MPPLALDRLLNLFRNARDADRPGAPRPSGGGRGHSFLRAGADKETVLARQSRGLEEFFRNIREQSGLTILDLGGASQENVSFITNLGHRLYSEDFLSILNDTFGLEDTTDQSNPGRIEYFLRQALDYPENHFDGILVWDMLEYLAPAMLAATVERLHQVTKPKANLLAFFHSDSKLEAVPYYSFRIQEFNVLQVGQHGTRRPVQLFNNRSLEKLFQKFDSVKFFLTRESLREVIVKR